MAEYDLIVRNGTIVDGTGGIPAYRGDVAVKDGKIAMISGRIKATATKEVDAEGRFDALMRPSSRPRRRRRVQSSCRAGLAGFSGIPRNRTSVLTQFCRRIPG
jgi:hypothetical protein